MRPRISIRGSVRPSVCPYVRMSVRYPLSKIHLIHLKSLAIPVIVWILPPSLPPPEFNFFQIHPFAFHCKNFQKLCFCSKYVFTYPCCKNAFMVCWLTFASSYFYHFVNNKSLRAWWRMFRINTAICKTHQSIDLIALLRRSVDLGYCHNSSSLHISKVNLQVQS